MNWQKYRWSIVGLTIIATLAVLAGGQTLWQQFFIAKPLSQLAQEIDGVKSVSLTPNGKSTQQINVTLANVANLQTTYRTLDNRIAAVLGRKNYEIILHNSSVPELERLYYSIHYDIQEAIFTGNFSSMAERIENAAAAAAASARVFVDDRAVYLQLNNDSGDFCIVLARQTKPEVR